MKYTHVRVNGSGTDGNMNYTEILNSFEVSNSVTKGPNYSNYKSRITRGLNATTRLSGVEYRRTSRPSYGYYASVNNDWDEVPHLTAYSVSGQIFPIGPPSTVNGSVTTALNQAKTRFVSSCREHQGAFKTGVFLGELRKTASLIGSSAKSLASGVSSYLTNASRIRSRVRKKDRLKVLADSWLEYSFGWKPLLSDIDDAAKEAARLHYHPPSVMIRSKGQSLHLGNQSNRSGSNGPLGWTYNYRDKETIEAKIYGKLKLETDDSLPRVAERLSLNLQDFVPTVWELVPYSFLIDYFTNVGDMLNAVSFNRAALSFCSYGTIVSTVREMQNMKQNPVSAGAGRTTVANQMSFGLLKWERRSVERYPELSTLVPTLEFSFPTSAGKIANLASLLISKHRKLLPFF